MAIQSLFGPSVAEIQELRRQQAEKEIAGAGQEFGVFAPLYQAGLRFGNQAVGGINTLMGAQDPRLQEATAVQSVLAKYANQDQTDPNVLANIGRELMPVAPNAGLKALTLAQQLQKEDKLITGKPGERIYRRTAQGLELVEEIPGKEEKVSPLDLARQSVLSLGSRDPNTLSQTERNELSAATTLLRLNAPGTTVNVGDKASSVAAGKAIGEAQAAIDNKYSALSSLDNAEKLLDAGIYAGPYAPLEQGLAKYSGGIIGSRKKVVNTERFLSEIGNTVIPRLQEFGGNDSVEELKYLRDVQGGKIDLEPETLKGIIKSARTKINTGIERLKAQSDAIEKGERLPLGPMPSEQPKGKGRSKGTSRTTASGIKYEILED